MKRLGLVPILLAACVAGDPNVDSQDQAVYGNTDDGDGCPKNKCGANSPTIDGVYFYELNEGNLENSEHIRITGYQNLPAGAIRLEVKRNELVARNAADVIVASGMSVLNSRFVLESGTDADVKQFRVEITQIHRTQKYYAADDNTHLYSYKLEYVQLFPPPPVVGGNTPPPKPVCPHAEVGAGLASLDALVFEGDRYDPVSKAVSVGASTKTWFNIACLGAAPAKMHLMRRTRAASNAGTGIITSLAERQTMFNMWIANYCGDGHVFTHPGQPLLIRDAHEWITPSWSWQSEAEIQSREAVWGPDGAVCLDVPRREADEPGIYNEIIAHCAAVGHPLPPCRSQPWFPDDWTSHGTLWTANPP